VSPTDYGEAQRRCVEIFGCGCPLCVCRSLNYPAAWREGEYPNPIPPIPPHYNEHVVRYRVRPDARVWRPSTSQRMLGRRP
jgi:hypothetical protein